MKLQMLNSSLDTQMYLERRVSSRNYTKFSDYTELDKAYQPWGPSESFSLSLFELPEQDVTLALNSFLNTELLDFYASGSHIKFPIHPVTLQIIPDISKKYFASHERHELDVIPTASSRTMLASQPSAHYIKTHLPIRISRFLRTLRRVSIETSMCVYEELCQWLSEGNGQFATLPHLLGGWHNDLQWGFLIRSIESYPEAEPAIKVPFFSLYSNDINHPDDEPLLVQLIKYHQADPIKFTSKYIVQPTVLAWAQTVSQLGIILEPHGQNTLLEIDPDTKLPTRIVIRDFQSPSFDPIIRQSRGLASNFYEEYLLPANNQALRQANFSNLYDYKIGHHCLNFFAKLIENYFDVDTTILKTEAKEIIEAELGKFGIFPPTMHIYREKQFKNNKQQLVDTDQAPIWR